MVGAGPEIEALLAAVDPLASLSAGPPATAPALGRGSSELHGWGASNLYLRRHREQLSLTVEHRAAPSLPSPSN
jgi:hypothetical protein